MTISTTPLIGSAATEGGNVFSNSANWLGRQISTGWEGIKSIVSATIEAIKPVFSAIGNFFVDLPGNLQYSFSNHPVAALGVTVALVGIAAGGVYFYLSSSEENNDDNKDIGDPQPTTGETQPANGGANSNETQNQDKESA